MTGRDENAVLEFGVVTCLFQLAVTVSYYVIRLLKKQEKSPHIFIIWCVQVKLHITGMFEVEQTVTSPNFTHHAGVIQPHRFQTSSSRVIPHARSFRRELASLGDVFAKCTACSRRMKRNKVVTSVVAFVDLTKGRKKEIGLLSTPKNLWTF